MVCRNSLGTRGNEEVVLCKLTVIDSRLEDAFSDDQNLRATVTRKNREEPDLGNLFRKVTEVTDTGSQGDETTGSLGMEPTEKEHRPPRELAARDGGLEVWRQRNNDCKPGQWTGDDHWPNQFPERRLRWYVRYHLSVTLGT